MSRISGICTLALLSFSALALPAHAAVFGSVVPIGGTSSDIALDESRGVLYIADFGNNVIDVMSITDNTIHSLINVLPLPGAIALSPDSTYLLVAHYCNLR
jgi:DNA-binding beta-propeller fold protein YncE